MTPEHMLLIELARMKKCLYRERQKTKKLRQSREMWRERARGYQWAARNG